VSYLDTDDWTFLADLKGRKKCEGLGPPRARRTELLVDSELTKTHKRNGELSRLITAVRRQSAFQHYHRVAGRQKAKHPRHHTLKHLSSSRTRPRQSNPIPPNYGQRA
jgi:hypothetical protein